MGADHPVAVSTVLLIQFAKSPRAGEVKTRMMPYLSAQAACALHHELTLWTCRQLLASGLGDVELAVAGDDKHALFEQCRALGDVAVSQQRGSDLGERMYHAISAGLRRYTAVILVGSDCPAIDAAYLESAVTALESDPVVMGPAVDGGYVLIGARAISPRVFQGITWGSARVYPETTSALAESGLAWATLPTLHDIDTPADLVHWDQIKLRR
jgi:rSAM/selenodomain-associated transferase 1